MFFIENVQAVGETRSSSVDCFKLEKLKKSDLIQGQL